MCTRTARDRWKGLRHNGHVLVTRLFKQLTEYEYLAPLYLRNDSPLAEYMSAGNDMRLGLCRSRIPCVSLQTDVAGRRRVQDEHSGANSGDPGRVKMGA